MRPFILLATLVASAVLATPALANGADLDEPAAVPRSHQIKAQHRRSALEAAAELASRAKKGARLTYYWGRQLEAPACGGPTPTDDDMIAAIVDPKKGGGYAKCGDRITLSHKGRQITVKVVDYCASCAVPGFDLSKGAFAKLADLDQGVIEDVEFWKTGSLLSSSQDDDEEIKLGGGSAAQNKGPREKQQLNRSHPSKSKSAKSKQQRKEARKQSRMAKKAAKKHGKKSKKSKKAKKDRHNDN